MNWSRVNKKDRCPICGKDSWCLVGDGAVLCMRQESDRPKMLKSGEQGWLHRQERSHPPCYPTQHLRVLQPTINCAALIGQWDVQTKRDWRYEFARSLGVSDGSLLALQCVYAGPHHAWAWPMKDAHENMVGIRLRSTNGDKWAVPGSHSGCFIPIIKPGPTVLITEGPTDCAAGLDLGYWTIGRPSCSGGAAQIKELVMTQRTRRAVILADNDAPGVQGAKTLAELLPIPCVIVCLPCKDLREFVRLGGTRQMLQNRIDQSVWMNVR